MSNIEPLLNAVDTLVELCNDIYGTQGEKDFLNLICQANYVSGIVMGYRMMTGTPPSVMKHEKTTTDTYRGSGSQITYTNYGYMKSD